MVKVTKSNLGYSVNIKGVITLMTCAVECIKFIADSGYCDACSLEGF